jgi:selenocysteine lyase/cysteine desulfurase
VVTTVLEHNSVLRPLRQLECEGIVEVTRVACDGNAFVDPDDVRKAIRPSTRLVALIHVSNVTGSVQPVAEIARLAAERDLLFLLDAAQSLGHVPVDVATWRVPLLAAPGHKGLLAPLGTGVLYVGPGAERTVQPVRQGGTGTQSERDQQPESLPDRYEAGNHNVPGILGLREGTAFVRARGVESLGQHISMLAEGFVQGVSTIRGVRVVGPSDPQRRAGVVSITVRGYDAHEAAMTLDVSYAIQVRGGLHCAPLAHRALGTLDHGGTVRFSFGAFNTMAEVERGVEAVAELAASA